MAIQWIAGDTFTCVSGDTKPTLVPTDTKAIETNTDDIYRFNGTSWVLYLANDKTETLTNKTIDSDVNTLKLPLSSVLVYKAGTTYKAKDMESGTTLATTSTTDAAVVINAAINNIPGAAARGWGGRIFIHAGDYDCKTEIAADIATTTYHGIELEGEGQGTRLNFTPASALTNGIRLKVARPRLANMRIYGNSNVTNLVQAIGPGGGPRHDWGALEHLMFDGANATALDTVGATVAGQKGFYMNGTPTALFFWTFNDLKFRGLDIGAHLFDTNSTSTTQTNIRSVRCDTAIKISAGQNLISNCWFQGDTDLGRFGIHLTAAEGASSGSLTHISNVHTELHKTATESAALFIDAGVANVYTNAVHNAYGDSLYWHHILDKSGANLMGNHHVNYQFRRPSQSKQRIGWWSPGSMAIGREGGLLEGNIVESPATTFTTAGTGNGPIKFLFTTGVANNISAIYFNWHDGYALEKYQQLCPK